MDTKHRANLPVLCSCFPLAIGFTFGSIYMSMPLSHFVPAYPPHPRVLKSILYVSIFIPVLPLGSSEPFFFLRFHIHVLAYGICFSLFVLLNETFSCSKGGWESNRLFAPRKTLFHSMAFCTFGIPFLLLFLSFTFNFSLILLYLRNLGVEQNLGTCKHLITWAFWLSVVEIFEVCFLITRIFGLLIWL